MFGARADGTTDPVASGGAFSRAGKRDLR